MRCSCCRGAKMVLRSKLRLAALVGVALMIGSLAADFLLAKNSTKRAVQDEHIAHTIISWRERTHKIEETHLGIHYGKVWNPVQSLRQLFPHATPRETFQPPSWPGNGFLFATVRGEFHEIRTAICDLVVIARLLNATLVVPQIHDDMATKSSSSKLKSFSYLYNQKHFIASLSDDVRVVRLLPKKMRSKDTMRTLVVKTPSQFAPVDFYMDEVLPHLQSQGACGLVLSGGGGLQSLLPADLAEYQRLRCRVAFHALRFRREIQELGFQLVQRLQEQGRPYLAVHLGLKRDALAYHGCAELFQDLQTESIQFQRAFLLRTGEATGELEADSYKQRRKGLCPLMPTEVGSLLRALGYRRDTRIFLAGSEILGGQRVLLPLRSVYHNLDDRFTLSTMEERAQVLGLEDPLPKPAPSLPPPDPEFAEKIWRESWEKSGPRPRPRAPPVPRLKAPHEVEGWWRWIGEKSSPEEEVDLVEEREQGHKLLWAALDYIVCVEANTFFPAFDRDRHGRPDSASLVMGHRLYVSASSKTYRPNRTIISEYMDKVSEHPYNLEQEWMVAIRNVLTSSLGAEGLANASLVTKPEQFLSHPLPECACQSGAHKMGNTTEPQWQGPDGRPLWGGEEACPVWMKLDPTLQKLDIGDGELKQDMDDPEIVVPMGLSSRGDDTNLSQLTAVEADELRAGEGDEDSDSND